MLLFQIVLNFSLKLLQKMLNKARQLFNSFDLFPVQVTLKSSGDSSVRSCPSAFISLIILGISLLYLVVNVISVINYDTITTLVQQTTVEDRFSTNLQFQTFALGCTQITEEQNLNLYSIFSAKLITITPNSSKSSYLQPCKSQNWQGLSQQQFLRQGIDKLLCPNNDDKFFLNGPAGAVNSTYIYVTITTCENSAIQNTECNDAQLLHFLQYYAQNGFGLQFYLYVLDVKIEQNNYYPITTYVNVDTKLGVTTFLGQKVFVEFSHYQVWTDGYYPWPQSTSLNGSIFNHVRWSPLQSFVYKTGFLAVIIFTTNQKNTIYRRQVAKLTDAFSTVGGLFSFIISICGVLLLSYNSYVYELHVSNNTFEKGDNKKGIKYTNFIYYIKYSIYKLFGKRFKWKDCKKIQKKRKQINYIMEIDKMVNRTKNLEIAVRHLVDRNEASCLGLIKKPTLKQAKNSRLEANYYQIVTKKRSELTIADLKLIYDSQGASLEQFYETTLLTKFRAFKTEMTEAQQIRSTQLLKQTSIELNMYKKETLYRICVADPNGQVQESAKNIQAQPTQWKSPQKQAKMLDNINMNDQKIQESPQNNEKIQEPVQNVRNMERNLFNHLHQEFKKQANKDIKILQKVISIFPQIQNQAKNLKLSKSYTLIESKLAECFYQMRPHVRASVQEKIPLIILSRLVTVIQKLQANAPRNEINQLQPNQDQLPIQKSTEKQDSDVADEDQDDDDIYDDFKVQGNNANDNFEMLYADRPNSDRKNKNVSKFRM